MAVATYQAHPALGLKRVDDAQDLRVAVPEPWASWSGDEEQYDLADRFLETVLRAFAGPGATFLADLLYPEDVELLRRHAEAAGVRVSRPRRGDWRGPLTPELAPAFPPASQLVLSVYVDGIKKLHLHDDIHEMVLYLEDDEAEDVRTRLAHAGFS